MNYQRFRANRWFTNWFASTEKNDAQGIEQRLTIGGGLGKYLVQSNSNELSVYYRYQSDPTEGADKADYGATTSVGYSYQRDLRPMNRGAKATLTAARFLRLYYAATFLFLALDYLFHTAGEHLLSTGTGLVAISEIVNFQIVGGAAWVAYMHGAAEIRQPKGPGGWS